MSDKEEPQQEEQESTVEEGNKKKKVVSVEGPFKRPADVQVRKGKI